MALPLIGMGLGLLGQGFRIGQGIKQNSLANKINPVFNQYATSPFAKARFGTASNLFNARMAGASNMEKNISSAQGNALSSIGRNATDASQALALAAASQGTADQAFSDLQTKESMNKYNMLDNLNQAYAQMIGEGDKEYNSKLQKYQMDIEEKNALRQAGMNNIYGGIGDLSSMSFLGSQAGLGFGRGRRSSAGGGIGGLIGSAGRK